MKRKRSLILILIFSCVCTLSFQNCGDDFAATQSLSAQLTGGMPGSAPALEDEDQNDNTAPTPAPSSATKLTSTDKSIGSITVTQTITWDLTTEVASGTKLSKATFSVVVSKYSPPDGSGDTYFVTSPKIKTGSHPIALQSLRLRFLGVTDEISTTFTGLDQVIPANTERILSKATLLHQLSKPATLQDTIGLSFAKFWPNDLPVPDDDETQLNGETLYANNCAACHGVLSLSTKPNRSVLQIKAAFDSAPQMTFLKTKLTDAEITAIANAL